MDYSKLTVAKLKNALKTMRMENWKHKQAFCKGISRMRKADLINLVRSVKDLPTIIQPTTKAKPEPKPKPKAKAKAIPKPKAKATPKPKAKAKATVDNKITLPFKKYKKKLTAIMNKLGDVQNTIAEIEQDEESDDDGNIADRIQDLQEEEDMLYKKSKQFKKKYRQGPK